VSDRLLLPGPFLVRVGLWLALLLACPLPPSTAALSFRIEVLGDTTFAAALPPESEPGNLQSEERRAPAQVTEAVLQYLESAEQQEHDAWLRDDIRIAWITTLRASRGEPFPHVSATYTVLGVHPDQVWPRIEARRRAMLGADYDKFFGGNSSPRKPVQSVKLAQAEVRRQRKKRPAA
jgi:hypothetical protein